MTDEPELEGAGLDGDEEAEGEGKRKRRGGLGGQDARGHAIHSLTRARKTLSGADADSGAKTEALVQSAIAWALLDLADAVRGQGGLPVDEASE